MVKKTYKVIGMHCVGCSMGISKLLKKTKGVSEVEVSLSESKFDITYDETMVNHQIIVDTVKKLGYRTVLDEK